MNDQMDDLIRRLGELERKVDTLLGNETQTSDEPQPQAVPEFTPSPKVSKAPINLLPIFAVICFGLAGIFIVNLAIESGWLTPERQWGLLVLFGLALTGAGLFLSKIEKEYRSYLGAAGLIVLYLAAYSSHLYFNLVSGAVSQLLGGLVSLLGFYLFHQFRFEFFVAICAIGTYISPLFLRAEIDLIFMSSFFLIWAGVFSRMAIYLQSRTLILLGSYLGLAIFTTLNLGVKDQTTLLNVILVQSLQFIIYAGGVFYYSVKNKSALSNSEAIAYLPILLFFYGTTYYFLNLYSPGLAPWISLGFAGFVYLLYLKAKKSLGNIHSQDMVQSFLGVVLFHSGYMQIIPASGKPWLLPLIIVAMFVAEKKQNFGRVSGFIKFLFSLMAGIEFLGICYQMINEADTFNVLPAAFTIGLGFFYYSKSSKYVEKESLFLALLHVLCVLALYRLAYDYGSLVISAVWGLYSGVVLVRGYTTKNAVLAKSSLLVLTVTCLKALLYDVNEAQAGVRIASLILTGVILYGAGWLIQKINAWEK